MTSPQSAENSNAKTENKEMLTLQLKTPTRRIVYELTNKAEAEYSITNQTPTRR